MRSLLLGSKTTKHYAKVFLVFLSGIVLWWLTVKLSVYMGLERYAFWLSLPFIVFSITAWSGLINIGPFKSGFKQAIEEDKREYNESITPKQPWEK